MEKIVNTQCLLGVGNNNSDWWRELERGFRTQSIGWERTPILQNSSPDWFPGFFSISQKKRIPYFITDLDQISSIALSIPTEEALRLVLLIVPSGSQIREKVQVQNNICRHSTYIPANFGLHNRQWHTKEWRFPVLAAFGAKQELMCARPKSASHM